MDDAMSDLFQRLLFAALEESETSAILIRATGKSFCSGRDTNVLGHRARDESDFHFVRRHQESRLRMMDSTKPIIAAVKGGAIGGGCRSEERRVGKEWVSTCRSRWWPYHTKKK